MRWIKPETDTQSIRSLAEKYNLDLLTATIFQRRGITKPDEIRYFLEEDLRFLHNPFLFEDMEDAVDRILTAKSEGEKVLVFGDRDVDGITAISLLIDELREMGLDVAWNLPMGNDPYGLSIPVVDAFAAAGGTLIITVDCGITNIDEIHHANELGIDTIVVDHHELQSNLPPACVIIDPKVPDCDYPFDGLCGCALAFKLVWALSFARCELYKQSICLMNVYPGNEIFSIDVVLLENLVEVGRLSEQVVPGMVDISQTRLTKFFNNPIFVFDSSGQTKMLQQVFGKAVEINLMDLAPEIAKEFPSLGGKSLLKLKLMSRMSRYEAGGLAEIDVLKELFITLSLARIPGLQEHSDALLDLVCLGTLADIMPLTNENRILVRRGLKRLAVTERPGLRKLMAKQKLNGRQVSARDIAWQLTPLINATGRLGEPDTAVKLFLAREPEEIDQLSNRILDLNRERRRIGDEAWERLLPQAFASFEECNSKFVCVCDTTLHRGVTGIIASRLVKQFHVPAIVMAQVDARLFASVRTVRGLNVQDFLFPLAHLFDDWGGHASAGGFLLPQAKLDTFKSRFFESLEGVRLHEDEDENLLIDAELPAEYMSPALEGVVETFHPFGEENPAICFAAKNLRLLRMDLIGRNEKKHLKLLLDSGKHKWPAVYWNAGHLAGNSLELDMHLDCVFHLGKNFYRNTENLQLTILDAKRTAGN